MPVTKTRVEFGFSWAGAHHASSFPFLCSQGQRARRAGRNRLCQRALRPAGTAAHGLFGAATEHFFDKKSIITGDYWESKIRQGLRSSRLFLAVLSPNYFASEWCRKEWTEYLRLEHGLSRSEGGILPVYFSYMPGLDPAEQIKLEAQLQL